MATAPAEAVLLTEDGIRLSAAHVPAAGTAARPDLAIAVVHGFSGSWREERVARVVEAMSAYAGVVALDQRGHGASGGACTLGHREVLDVEAAVAWARSLGYRAVSTLGFSMGASVVVRHQALIGGSAAVVAVSGPAFWFYRGTRVMRRLHLAVESPVGRWGIRRFMRTRVHHEEWPEPRPMPPWEAAGRLGAAPLLVVHGDRDRFFPVEHAQALHRAAVAAGTDSDLWLEPGFGHAESAIDDPLLARIGGWIISRARPEAAT